MTAHLGAHYLDLACQLLGAPTSVRLVQKLEAAPGIDSQLAATIGFDSGATLALLCTSAAPRRLERLTVLGADGWLELEDGACLGAVAGRELDRPRRAARELRAEVYRELAATIRGRLDALTVSALADSWGVTAVLEQLAAARGDREVA